MTNSASAVRRAAALRPCVVGMLCLLSLLAIGSVACAADEAGTVGLEVTTGFAGVSKTAAWTPVRVRLPAPSSARQVRVWAADPEDQPVGSPWQLLSEVDGSREATVHVRQGRPDGQLMLELEDADGNSKACDDALPIGAFDNCKSGGLPFVSQALTKSSARVDRFLCANAMKDSSGNYVRGVLGEYICTQ